MGAINIPLWLALLVVIRYSDSFKNWAIACGIAEVLLMGLEGGSVWLLLPARGYADHELMEALVKNIILEALALPFYTVIALGIRLGWRRFKSKGA
jgi:hypothetical protein